MKDTYAKAAALEEAAGLEGAELGEWWSALAALIPRVYDNGSKEFVAAFEKQLSEDYKRLKEEFRIKVVTETKTVAYRELQHESEWDD